MIYTCRANAFVMIPEVALEDSRLTRNDICVLAALYKFAEKNDKKKTAKVERVAFKTLAAESKMSANSKATFYESVNRLEKYGYIEKRIRMMKNGEYDNTTYILKDARSVSHLTPVKEGTMIYSTICNKLVNDDKLVPSHKEAKEFVEKTRIIVYDMVNGDGERIKSYAVEGFKDDKFIDMKIGVSLTLDDESFTLSKFDELGIVEMPVEKADKDETTIETPQEDSPVQPVEEKTPVIQEPQEDKPLDAESVNQEFVNTAHSNVVPIPPKSEKKFKLRVNHKAIAQKSAEKVAPKKELNRDDYKGADGNFHFKSKKTGKDVVVTDWRVAEYAMRLYENGTCGIGVPRSLKDEVYKVAKELEVI